VTAQINFPELEERILRQWYEKGIVDKYLHRNDASHKKFSFLDGPITANNPMGVHHAWGRTYKDLWQRFYTLRGYKERFQNGFDCQGLWVEVEVEKELGLRNKKDIENLVPGDKKASIAKFVDLCRERVRKYSAIQTEQSKRLGYIVDWDNSYYTMSDENNYMIWYFLKRCFEKGWIKKSNDVVPWCPRCETAISQHEILTEDYKVVTHNSLYLQFPVAGRDREYLLVWTTTPWTIPANIAVAVDSNSDYILVEDNTGDHFWIAESRLPSIFTKGYKTIVKKVKGKELEGLTYTGPFDHLTAVKKVLQENHALFHHVILTDSFLMPISTEEGTGLVHTSTGTGEEDSRLGKKLGLPVIPAINDVAQYLPDFDDFAGKNAKKHPELIVDYLKDHWIFSVVPYTHRYPVCWRCKTELVWKVADEWYVAMDVKEKETGVTLREQMKKTAQQISWKPAFGLERELDWLTNMHDWLISKPNRYWGLALPIYECTQCGWFTVIGSYEELKEKAVTGWDSFTGHTPHKPYIDDVKITCDTCGKVVSRVNDVGNVWLDAGIVGFSTLVDPSTGKLSYTTDKKYWREWFPADFITESFPGQFKNWFYSMIAMSTVLEKTTCFKTVLAYASVLAEDGRAMHKSLGNAIDFNEGAGKIGVDVMRWMFVRQDPEQNLLFGYKKADETRRQFHLLLWNVYNFFITYANIDGWSPENRITSTNVLDTWILSRLGIVTDIVTNSLVKYDAFSASTELEAFVADLSQWYVRRSRDRIGPSVENSKDKTMCYATLYRVLVSLSILLAPFTPFVSDEIYRNLTGGESVHLADWPDPEKTDILLESDMELARRIVETAHAARKEKKIKVRQPLALLTYQSERELSGELAAVIAAEINVKRVVHHVPKSKKIDLDVSLDFVLTDGLKAEGDARGLVREIQILRKEKGCTLDAHIILTLPKDKQSLSQDLRAYIQKETLSDTITWGDTLTISTG